MQCHPALWQEVGSYVPSLYYKREALCPPLSQHALQARCKWRGPPPTVSWIGPLGAGEDMLLSAVCLHDWFFLKAVGGLWTVALFSEEVLVVALSPLQHNQL